MKITKSYLKQVIKEELQKEAQETYIGMEEKSKIDLALARASFIEKSLKENNTSEALRHLGELKRILGTPSKGMHSA